MVVDVAAAVGVVDHVADILALVAVGVDVVAVDVAAVGVGVVAHVAVAVVVFDGAQLLSIVSYFSFYRLLEK